MKSRFPKPLTLSIGLFYLLCSQFSFGQNGNALTIGVTQRLNSKILNESRDLYVYRPDEVKLPLPLIIVFDAESLFGSVVSTIRFMNYSQELPQVSEAMVVGIPNTDRNRDMPIPQLYGEKGEENFARFLSDELIPMIKSKYALNGHVILIGHSQGGLFVSYLLSQAPDLFRSAIALDAPMDIDKKIVKVKQKIVQLTSSPSNKVTYISMEAAYGWGKDWDGTMSKATGTYKMVYPDETHESMPQKAIYDGLKFMYRGFAPPKRDMQLVGLLHHYKDVSEKFGYDYEVPKKVLLASADRKIMDNRKHDASELLDFTEDRYGPSERINLLRTKASKLADNVDPLVEFYLNHSKPSGGEIGPYVGRWMGDLLVTKGEPIPIDMEIKIENGQGKMVSVLPWPPHDKEVSEILFVSQNGELVFGRKNRGAGLVISTARIAKNGNLAGKEVLVGFIIQEDMPDEVKKMMKFIIENPNTFDLKKAK